MTDAELHSIIMGGAERLAGLSQTDQEQAYLQLRFRVRQVARAEGYSRMQVRQIADDFIEAVRACVQYAAAVPSDRVLH